MKKIISIFIIALVLVSCALESEFNLPKSKNVSSNLFGTWITKDHSGKIVITQKENDTFSVLMIDEKGTEEMISTNAYLSKINNFDFINLVNTSEKGKTINTFYNIRFSKNTFNVREVNSKFTDKVFKSNDELLNYFKENITKKGFFNKWEDGFIKK